MEPAPAADRLPVQQASRRRKRRVWSESESEFQAPKHLKAWQLPYRQVGGRPIQRLSGMAAPDAAPTRQPPMPGLRARPRQQATSGKPAAELRRALPASPGHQRRTSRTQAPMIKRLASHQRLRWRGLKWRQFPQDAGALQWADGLPGVQTARYGAGRAVLNIERGKESVVDQAVLAAALRTGPVHEFSRRQPSLTELFREVVAA